VTEQQYPRPGAYRFGSGYPQWVSDLPADDDAFAVGVRERAASWEGDHLDVCTDTWEDDDDRTGVVAVLDLPTIEQFGAAHVQGRLHCGPVHPNLTHFLRPWSPGLEYDGQGSPEELAHQACDWFEALMRRPLVLWLWQAERSEDAQAFYAGRYEFADGGDLFAEWFDPLRAPAVETARAREGGYFVESPFGPSLTTETLAHPDAFVFIRGDRPAARIPEGCRELPSMLAVGPVDNARVLDYDWRWGTRRARDLGLRRWCRQQ
jgi:hypothetical protein